MRHGGWTGKFDDDEDDNGDDDDDDDDDEDTVVEYDESDKFENSDRFCRNDMMKVMTVWW